MNKYRFFYDKTGKKNNNKKKIRIVNKIEDKKDLKDNIIIQNFNEKNKNKNKKLFPKLHIDSPNNLKNSIKNKVKFSTEPHANINNKNELNKASSENWYSRVRTKYNNELLLEFGRDKNLNKRAFISSIPGKERSYGYTIEENGNMTPKENPDNLQIFSGLGKDTVGPGNYDINMKWNKTLSL